MSGGGPGYPRAGSTVPKYGGAPLSSAGAFPLLPETTLSTLSAYRTREELDFKPGAPLYQLMCSTSSMTDAPTYSKRVPKENIADLVMMNKLLLEGYGRLQKWRASGGKKTELDFNLRLFPRIRAETELEDVERFHWNWRFKGILKNWEASPYTASVSMAIKPMRISTGLRGVLTDVPAIFGGMTHVGQPLYLCTVPREIKPDATFPFMPLGSMDVVDTHAASAHLDRPMQIIGCTTIPADALHTTALGAVWSFPDRRALTLADSTGCPPTMQQREATLDRGLQARMPFFRVLLRPWAEPESL